MKNQDSTIIVENSPTNGHSAPAVEMPTLDPVIVDPVTVETINIEADGSEQAQAKGRAPRMLYRHPTDKMAGGVAGGLAETFNLDPSLVRILWLVLTVVTGGGGLLAYLALWLFLPVGTANEGQQGPAALELNDRNMGRAAFLLIGLGVIWFLSNIGALPWLWNGFASVMSLFFWPALLIGAGYLILRGRGKEDGEELAQDLRTKASNMGSTLRQKLNGKAPSKDDVKASMRNAKQRIPFKRSRTDRMFLGVCGGLGRTLGIDANLVRLIWAAFSIGSLGTGVLIYVLVGLLLPEEVATSVTTFSARESDGPIIDGKVTTV